jgi:hypothetical protein
MEKGTTKEMQIGEIKRVFYEIGNMFLGYNEGMMKSWPNGFPKSSCDFLYMMVAQLAELENRISKSYTLTSKKKKEAKSSGSSIF